MARINIKKLLVPLSPAELMDKISILEVKALYISAPEKLANVRCELEILRKVFKNSIKPSKKLNNLFNQLRILSARGWKIEDKKRLCEKKNDFGPKFIKSARAAFKNNDQRAAVWKKINTYLNSDIVQEKQYEKY